MAAKRSDLVHHGRCPECGEEVCYDAWLIGLTISPVARDSPFLARNTCIRQLFAHLANPKSVKSKHEKRLLSKYPDIGKIFKHYGYPGLLNEITHEMLGVIAPPKKNAIRRWKEEMTRRDEEIAKCSARGKGIDVGTAVLRFLTDLTNLGTHYRRLNGSVSAGAEAAGSLAGTSNTSGN
jgi:hypothetical protein